ncbi:hypothetical protein BH10PSE3_BH10PSE3_37150 [soil metagenome]
MSKGQGRSFSWSGATLAGLGVLRREPRVLLTWSLVGLVLTVAQQVMTVNADIFRKVNPASLTAPLLNLAGGVIALGALAIFSAAAYRVVLMPEDRTRARIRFGRDEIRLALVWLVQGVLLLFPFLVTVVPVIIATLGASMPFLTLGAFLAAVLASGWLLARLSVAGPMAVMEGGWTLPAAWRLTRGRGWKIAGVHLCVVLMAGAVYWACRVLYGLVVHAMGGQFLIEAGNEATSVAAMLQPETLIFTLISAVLGAAGSAMLYAPAAVIYRDLKGLTPDDQASVFD